MRYELYSHRFAEDIINQKDELRKIYDDVRKTILELSDDVLIKEFEHQRSIKPSSKSLSHAINHLVREKLIVRGWKDESFIFNETDYNKKINEKEERSSNPWRIDFVKEGVSMEIAFNHSNAVSWNLLKPTLASELNHVKKEIQTQIGIIVCATSDLRKAGNFDSAIGTFDHYKKYLIPLYNQISIPILVIGLKSPETFIVNKEKREVEML
ncbi:MAG: BglII/BstYI family type II restriction endonuclease [Culicoidibacterales bacterium]